MNGMRKMMTCKFLHKNIFIFVILVLLLLKWAPASAAPSWQWIDGQRVQNQITEGSSLWLIDVRSAAVYESGHIEGSVNIPAVALAHKKFGAQKTIILVDDSLGQKTAREAADTLIKNGHERVSVLEGGIVAWKTEALPLVERNPAVRGVTAAELKWALANSVPIKLFDLRDGKAQKLGALQNSETISAKTLDERVEKLKKILANDGKKKDLAARMQKMKPVVLVFAARDDAEAYTKKVLQAAKGDVRYLIGGYEALISDKLRKQQTSGICPTCPAGKGK